MKAFAGLFSNPINNRKIISFIQQNNLFYRIYLQNERAVIPGLHTMIDDQSKELIYNQYAQVPGTEQIEGLEEMKSRIIKANGLSLVKELPSKEGRTEKGAMQSEFLNDSILTKIKQ